MGSSGSKLVDAAAGTFGSLAKVKATWSDRYDENEVEQAALGAAFKKRTEIVLFLVGETGYRHKFNSPVRMDSTADRFLGYEIINILAVAVETDNLQLVEGLLELGIRLAKSNTPTVNSRMV